MTASYVVVTALAVLIVEAVVIGVAAPRVLSSREVEGRVQVTASVLAAKISAGATQPGGLGVPILGQLRRPMLGQAEPDGSGGVMIPQIAAPSCLMGPTTFAVFISPSGTILASSYPACFAVGSKGFTLPAGTLSSFSGPTARDGTASLPSGQIVWAAQPVEQGAVTDPKSSGPGTFLGTLYVQSPAKARGSGGINPSLLRTGLVLLGLTVLLGVAFGLLSTRRLTRRVHRLTASTQDVADREFDRRVPVSGGDEVSQLEDNFNRMAERLETSIVAERQLAGANARHEERSRIARELHDSISQDLFSLSMLAGGLRKALPADSSVQPEVETMERTAAAAMREMQALLLELRPIALDEAGLPRALDELCGAYRERLGVEVMTDVEPIVLPTALEHTLLRVAQESVANAVKHANAKRIRLGLHAVDGRVVLEVSDDGSGFDLGANGRGGGLGLRAMRERTAEQEGELVVESAPGRGTTVRASFPRSDR